MNGIGGRDEQNTRKQKKRRKETIINRVNSKSCELAKLEACLSIFFQISRENSYHTRVNELSRTGWEFVPSYKLWITATINSRWLQKKEEIWFYTCAVDMCMLVRKLLGTFWYTEWHSLEVFSFFTISLILLRCIARK